MGKEGRPRKYQTAAALRRAVEGYFHSISYRREVIIFRREIVREEGKDVIQETPVICRDADGEPMMETVWREEPSKAALCLYLGISRDTWAEYAKDEKKRAVTEWVDAQMLARLEAQLNTRNSVQGVIFNLKANYGWREKLEITQDGALRVELGPGLEELAR